MMHSPKMSELTDGRGYYSLCLFVQKKGMYMKDCYELAEADELCHGNWIEIQHLRKYIDVLHQLLEKNKIAYPQEYEI